ncbi:MAG TPA: hypothetical protein VE971_04415, partial [Candidatus Eisenbacteria bacterium]|nr:hypothetical protein [Candidatus Eisenbacteria bacterium]
MYHKVFIQMHDQPNVKWVTYYYKKTKILDYTGNSLFFGGRKIRVECRRSMTSNVNMKKGP